MSNVEKTDKILEIPISFINPFQKLIFGETKRNICGSGGYGNGKTVGFCEKLLLLMCTFPGYRVGIFRKVAKDLRNSTMQSFYKVCPPALYDESKGGRRADSFGELRLINGSEAIFMQLEKCDINILRGLELNACLIDQAEEIDEETYLHLDARVGRWDLAQIPPELSFLPFPKNPVTGKQIPPSYTLIACNPDHLLHWIYKRYHPDSDEHKKLREDIDGTKYRYSDTHVMYEADSRTNPALDRNTLRAMMQRDRAFVRRFVEGKWGIPEGAIHIIHESSRIKSVDERQLRGILAQSRLYRAMDHGETSPTCVLWVAHWREFHIFYREYYQGQTLVSEHRQNIYNLSLNDNGYPENYAQSIADPQIFKKTGQRLGSYWSTSDEYLDMSYKAPPIIWTPANNDEMMGRNRLSELLKFDPDLKNPFTGAMGSTRAFFIERSEGYPHGCDEVIKQIIAQKRVKEGTLDGQDVFSDERDPDVIDHAYDPARYYANLKHPLMRSKAAENVPGSFMNLRKRSIHSRQKEHSRRLYA